MSSVRLKKKHTKKLNFVKHPPFLYIVDKSRHLRLCTVIIFPKQPVSNLLSYARNVHIAVSFADF